jgi:hypothetical protein
MDCPNGSNDVGVRFTDCLNAGVRMVDFSADTAQISGGGP